MSTTTRSPILKINGTQVHGKEDFLAVEEPLEIRLSFLENNKRTDKSISVTMRTPGQDEELAAGFLFTEGIINEPGEIETTEVVSDNIIRVILKETVAVELGKLARHFYTSSSCGVCGKSSIEAIHTLRKKRPGKSTRSIRYDVLYKLPESLRHHQEVFEKTGGLHAAALFTDRGEFLLSREDVGRHNALDKLIGASFRNNTASESRVLLLSGRASFELIQKAAMAAIETVAAVGAPSSLAVELAREQGMTLVGFLKENSFNIYCGNEKITIG
jgi:FdhD protein